MTLAAERYVILQHLRRPAEDLSLGEIELLQNFLRRVLIHLDRTEAQVRDLFVLLRKLPEDRDG